MKYQNNDGLITIIEQVLARMSGLGVWQKRFMKILFISLLTLRGRVNFSNLARHSELNEKTYRRGFEKDFDFENFNLAIIQERPVKGELVAAIDTSYLPKAGKKTYGLGKFYSSCLNKAVKGLEISEIALIDRDSQQAYAFSTKQTVEQENKSRLELYIEHLELGASKFPQGISYLLADGYYTKKCFIDAVCKLEEGLDIVGKLRCDANLNYLYQGSYSGYGRPKLYDGKVDFKDLSRFVYEREIDNNLHLYTQTLWHLSLKRKIKVLFLLNTSEAKSRYILLFSTDLSLSGAELLELYKLRFQIEFLFRDAKQFTGLSHCQSRKQKTLSFHFNASFSAVNLAKLDLLTQHHVQHIETADFVFSLRSYTQRLFSLSLLSRLLSNLDLDPSCIKVQTAFNNALAFGFSDP